MSISLPGIALDSHRIIELNRDWQLAATAPGACADPAQALAQALAWREAIVPGTVASSLGADLAQPQPFDASDWWYRCTFAAPQPGPLRLRLDGLATLAEVWLNGALLLTTDNMYVAHCIDLGPHLRIENELAICFRSLDAALAARRPRPRWKTALVNHQQLRWFRTTLLGRMPGWTPALTAVGPWKKIALECPGFVDVLAFDLQTRAQAGVATLELSARLHSAHEITSACIVLGAKRYPLSPIRDDAQTTLNARLELPEQPLWWPHTHGAPALVDCRLEITSGSDSARIDCGRVGFKDMQILRASDTGAERVQFQVNGTPVFCRGACWTNSDLKSLTGTPQQLRETLTLARDAGANMLRIGGTMIYESDEFYTLCDELGILVWQDFMFANMDYPVADAQFAANIEREVRQQLQRLQRHPCMAVYCGGSEIEQQAAMLGLPADEWTQPFFTDTLPALCAQLHGGIPYFRNSPCEGALPFHAASGIAHYYGVGAYRRPLDDARRARVKFSAESLGLSNVPEPETVALMLNGALPVPHHPAWKAGVPRDNGAGLDFEDVRDHYLAQLFELDPIKLRSTDPERYYALSRAVSGEVMKRVYAEWRRPQSECGGALVWFLKDLRPGAGWGVIDSENRPKAVYHALKRSWARQSLHITDEGLDGLYLHIVNEHGEPLAASVELEVFQAGRILIASATQALTIAPHAAATLQSDALLAHFSDLTYAYRFGPPRHDTVIARLRCARTGATLSEDFYFPQGLSLPCQDNAELLTETRLEADGSVITTLESNCLLQTVNITSGGYTVDDNYFHLAPHQRKRIRFSPAPGPAKKFKAYLSALNLRESITVRVNESV